MRLAILGGTFNPPHIGHFVLADAVHTELAFDKVLLVPSCVPPHKQDDPGVSPGQRLEMTAAAARESGFAAVSDCEIARGGRSYTIDTLRFVLEEYSGKLEGKPSLVIGSDWIPELYTWHRAEEIAASADIIVAGRPGFPPPEGLSPGEAGGFLFPHMKTEVFVRCLGNPQVSVSSSDIRRRIRDGKSWRYLVPGAVYTYIVEHALYER